MNFFRTGALPSPVPALPCGYSRVSGDAPQATSCIANGRGPQGALALLLSAKLSEERYKSEERILSEAPAKNAEKLLGQVMNLEARGELSEG
jgi:hypothetical protein